MDFLGMPFFIGPVIVQDGAFIADGPQVSFFAFKNLS
jgi:hypothetical protein